jgi:hypothetical protein
VENLRIGKVSSSGGIWRWESKFFKGDLIPIADSEMTAMQMVEKSFFSWWSRVLKGAQNENRTV